MDSDKYTRSVTMICPTCAHKDFVHRDDSETLRCTSCDRTFTRDELIRENGKIIDAETAEMKDEVLADVKKEMKDMLRKAFKGSKSIKFK